MIIQSKWFCSLIGVRGICLWPFIIVNDKQDEILINHERIHFAQQVELWVLPFYYLYFKDYLKNKKKFKDHFWSYYSIYFEREAFANQDNLNYLLSRKKKAYNDYKLK